jgi:rSAM/selenodomain-associated transferase 2
MKSALKISVIIPTLNEAANIQGIIEFILNHGNNSIADLIVVDGGSKDATVKLAIQSGARVLISPMQSRASQMNLGARHATGDILYFVHADVKLLPTFVEDIRQSVSGMNASGCYRYRFDSDKVMLRINGYCTRFDKLMCRGGDQTLFITKQAFENLGGYNEEYIVMEDYEFLIRLRKKIRFQIIPKEVNVSARKYENNSWLRVQVVNLLAFLLFYAKASPATIRKTYYKLLNYR